MTKSQIKKVINKLQTEYPDSFKENKADLLKLCLSLDFQIVNAQMNDNND